MNKIIWLIATARNALLVIISGLIASKLYVNKAHSDLFLLVGYIPSGLPNIQLPPFSINETRNDANEIIQNEESFFDMLSFMGSGLIVIPLLGLLENMAICKTFGKYLNLKKYI